MTILKNQKIYFDGYDLTGTTNAVAFDYGCETTPDTVFGMDVKSNMAGLKTSSVGVQGYFNASSADKALYNAMGAENKVITIANSADAGALAYFLKGFAGNYKCDGAVGEAFKYSMSAAAQGRLIRGKVLTNENNITSVGISDDLNYLPIASGKKLYATLHVFKASGTSPALNVVLNSSNGITPVEIGSFAEVTGIGSQMIEIGEVSTNEIYNCEWTVSGTGASFDFAVVIGVI